MGWERKRGKLEEFNGLLRGATDTSFAVQVGDMEILPGVRYCLTLDSDTRLPRDAAKKLIGILAHPLNRAHFDPRLGHVTEGTGSSSRAERDQGSAAGSLCALYDGPPGDPYTTAGSDTYQDVLAGHLQGKGSMTSTRSPPPYTRRARELAPVPRPIEGVYARTGRHEGRGGRISRERPRHARGSTDG